MPAAQRRRAPPRPTRGREIRLWRAGCRRVAGVDEVGRGPLAGPVTAGAVVLQPHARPAWLHELRDSKQLSPTKRRRLASAIRDSAVDWALGWAAAQEVDSVGIVAATRLAMLRALAALSAPAEFVLVDGQNELRLGCPTEAIVRGDAAVTCIAAASVLAKVARDAWMAALDARFQGYGFRAHKGYGTAAHLAALRQQGPCPEHRFSFAPVRASMRQALRPAASPLGCAMPQPPTTPTA